MDYNNVIALCLYNAIDIYTVYFPYLSFMPKPFIGWNCYHLVEKELEGWYVTFIHPLSIRRMEGGVRTGTWASPPSICCTICPQTCSHIILLFCWQKSLILLPRHMADTFMPRQAYLSTLLKHHHPDEES